jgi:uncharacterized protein
VTPQEQQLITELFARLKQTPAQATDTNADQLIRNGVIDNPQAPYRLVQTVLIQDLALRQAEQRVAELERQLAEATAASSAQPSQPATSFLGGLLSRGSVPPANPPSGGAPAPVSPIASASSGFLRGAAETALGVVGGQLLFHGIQSMFGQHAGSILSGQSVQPPLSETVVHNVYGDQSGSANAEPSSDDADEQDTNDDPTAADDDPDSDLSDQDAADDDTFDGTDTDLS